MRRTFRIKRKCVVCGARRLHRRTPGKRPARTGHPCRSRAWTSSRNEEWYQQSPSIENLILDLQEKKLAKGGVEGIDVVFNLAADMGGMGFIENNKALCMLSVLINTHLLLARRQAGIERFFFSSSACVYNGDKQKNPQVRTSQRGGCLSGAARRWLRLGKTFQRANVPPF